jgi:hypothetical protein
MGQLFGGLTARLLNGGCCFNLGDHDLLSNMEGT